MARIEQRKAVNHTSSVSTDTTGEWTKHARTTVNEYGTLVIETSRSCYVERLSINRCNTTVVDVCPAI